MTKHKIITLLLIVTLIIILILLYSILFGAKPIETENGTVDKKQPQITLSPTTTIPEKHPDYPESSQGIIDELNTAKRVEYHYTLSNGEVYTIAIPEGLDPPPLSVAEKMYKIEKGQE